MDVLFPPEGGVLYATAFKIQSLVLLYLKEIRYEVTNADLGRLIRECWLILFGGVHDRVMFTWKNFRNPTRQEVKWYHLVWGRRRANTFFANYRNNLGKLNNNNNNNTNSLKTVKKSIKMHDERFKRNLKQYKKTMRR